MNPLGFAYTSTVGLEAYARPSAVLITGWGNRYSQAFANARAAGAEVLAYINVVERPDKATDQIMLKFYMGDVSKVPLWIPPRSNYPGQMLTDMRVGSAWVEHCLVDLEALMREDTVDGVFLDVVGARLWSPLAAWDTWSQGERDDWSEGNLAFVRRLDAIRRSVNDEFKIVTNNLWELEAYAEGRIYIDGVCIEHHPSTRPSARAAAARAYSPLGHRRVFWIATYPPPPKTLAQEVEELSQLPGVTHISDQVKKLPTDPSPYLKVTPPPVEFNDLRLTEALVRNARLQAKNYELAAEKRAMDEQLGRIRTQVGELVAEVAP